MTVEYSPGYKATAQKRLDAYDADPIVAAVRADLLARSQVGIVKYGVTLADAGLTRAAWLRHAYEEACDQVLYLKAALDAAERTCKCA